MVQLANLMATELKLLYVTVSGPSGGIVKPDGSWSSVIGMVHQVETYLAIANSSLVNMT